MIQTILFSLWFFLPAGTANMAPIFAAKIPFISSFSYPIDFYKTYKEKRVFGDHKTIRGLLAGIIVGIIICIFQVYVYNTFKFIHLFVSLSYNTLNPFILGSLLGAGALIGDMSKSFLKRQYNIPPGKSWLFFDQIDYIIGAIVFSMFYVRIPMLVYIISCILWFFLHTVVSFIGYLLKLKQSPI